MSKNEFISDLRERLSHIPAIEVQKVLQYYIEMIDDRVEDGMSEQDAVKSLGSLDEIVKNIENEISLGIVVKEKVKEKTEKNGKIKNIIIITLLILGFPIWGSLLIAGVVIVGSLYITVWSLLIAGIVLYFSLVLIGITSLIFGLFRIFLISIFNGIAYTGMGFIFIGLAIMLFLPTIWFIKKWVYLSILPFRKLKKVIIRKG